MKSMKTLWRSFRARKIYYFINVIGLSLGIASAVFILLWIVDELSYEKIHQKADQIFQVHKQYRMGDKMQVNRSLPVPLGPSLEATQPEIIHAIRVVPQRGVFRYGENLYSENTACAADPFYFEVFSYDFMDGDPGTCLEDPYSIVITQEKAKKYFGTKDPMGKVLELDGQKEYTVTGIIRDIAQNTSLNYDMIIPFSSVYTEGPEEDNWYDHFLHTYLLLDGSTSIDSLNARITRHIRSQLEEDSSVELFAYPIQDLHLHDPAAQSPRIRYIYIFSIVGILILLIACINYVNVSTFVSLRRSREIGVRKINGGSRKRLITQFFGETFQQTILGFILAMALVELFRMQFNHLTGKSIVIPYLEPWFILTLSGLILITVLLAGSYPAILISAFRPVDAFRGRIITGKGQVRFRTILLVLQFTISVGLIITTLTMYNQVRYMQFKDLGFHKENLIYLILEDAHRKNFEVFKEELLAHPQITHVCRSSSLPISVWNIVRGFDWEGYDEEKLSAFSFLAGDKDLMETLGLELISGRGFSQEFINDSNRVLINEEAARYMGFDDPVGKAFIDDSLRTEIIGVFKDFHGLPLTESIEPMIIAPWEDYFYFILVRILPGKPKNAIAHMETTWKSLYPAIPFEYNFVEDRISRQYRSEIRIGKLSGAFTILAILITCIGLFAIAGHTAQKTNKEIGIRKAMGASGRSVVRRFVFIYLKWVVVANCIAIPFSWLMMNNWLDNFAYRAPLGIWVFLLATVLSIFISVITIGWHAWNASRINPVLVLQYE